MGEMGEEGYPPESPGSPTSHVIAEIEKPRLPLIGTDDTDLNWARDLNADQRGWSWIRRTKPTKRLAYFKPLPFHRLTRRLKICLAAFIERDWNGFPALREVFQIAGIERAVRFKGL
jgi:hypothetical protein